MNAPFRTSAAIDDRDVRHAEAFRDLESQIMSTRSAALTADLIFEDAGHPGSFGQDVKRRLPGLARYTVLVLTEEQYEALHYTMRRVRDEAELLRKAYYAGFGGHDSL